jgi:hypothetical protein
MLGPPVCVPCRRVMDHIATDAEWLELRKTYPTILRWWCSRCKKVDGENTESLLALTDRELFKELMGDWEP